MESAAKRRGRWRVAAALFVIASAALGLGCGGRFGAPEPTRAWVAISVGEDPVARTGPIEIEVGTPFTLHAVLEAVDADGESTYYTEARSLEIEGQSIGPDAIATWSGRERPSVLWFTVEGSAPVIDAAEPGALESFEFREFFRADWPRSWSIPGDIEPVREAALDRPAELRAGHGTQRYHVRIELFGAESEIVPAARLTSRTAAELIESVDRFATVSVVPPGTIGLAAGVFGLPQFDGGAPDGVDLTRWVERRLGFSRPALLRAIVTSAGADWQDLEWTRIDLADRPRWDGPEGLRPGALLRVGDRVAVLFRDRGELGQLDYEDLCFDYIEGAEVRPLSDVFAGTGLVELAALGQPRTGREETGQQETGQQEMGQEETP